MTREYKYKANQWDKFASVRSRPRRILETDSLDYFYPIERQPICSHELVVARGEETIKKILLQTAYKFMLDIANIEVEVINKTAMKIYNKTIDFDFSYELRHDVLSIVVDEAFHAYVALDFISQLINKTNIQPIYESEDIELVVAMMKHMPSLSVAMQPVFELVAICIGENTLTKELFSMTKQDGLNSFFQQVMADHMIDEGRHSNIFRFILTDLWTKIDDDTKTHIGAILPHFIIDYLSHEIQVAFDKRLLSSLDFSDDDIEIIIKDTHQNHSTENLVKINPVIRNILDFIKSCGLLDHQATFQSFKDAHLTT